MDKLLCEDLILHESVFLIIQVLSCGMCTFEIKEKNIREWNQILKSLKSLALLQIRSHTTHLCFQKSPWDFKTFCFSAAKAAKYGPLQGFFGGVGGGGGAYRGKRPTHTHTSRLPHECYQVLVLKAEPFSLWRLLQVALQDARANTVGGGSRGSLEIQWPQETMVLLHDRECTFKYANEAPLDNL